MYYPINGGSVEDIQGYPCQLPPIGYGKNRLTGEIEYVGVIKRSSKKEEQRWQRIDLPADWDKRRKVELRQQEKDPDYIDSELEKIRETHWQYRLCGLWVMINGTAIYIPPSYYVYLNWCPLDVGYPTYREPDRWFYCVWEYCCEDPRCAGMVDIERRRQGKSFRAGSILLDRSSINKNHHAGIQSKTGADAKAVFIKAVITFFKKWPDFFRPVYDQSKGVTPSSELRFFQTVRRGRFSDSVIGAKELESWIDWGTSEIYYYDGSKLNSYMMDEYGKTQECDVWDRWNVVRFCLDQDGVFIGKALLTSTIEDMENGGENAQRIWLASDPATRDANGRTRSGLYRFFLPAYETTFFDEFGMPMRDKAKEFYLNQRAGLQHDHRALSSIIRKNPFTIEEAFRVDGQRCLFDAMKLNLQLDTLVYKQNLTERGNFVWQNGEPFTKIVWEKSKNGRWRICWLFDRPEESNKVIVKNGRYYPNNYMWFTIGVDPFKYDAVKTARRSDCAAFVFKKFDIVAANDPFNNAFVCMYLYRAATTYQQYDDILKMAWYYGAQVLFERNIDNWKDFFTDKKCEGFLMKLPGEKEFGIYSDGQKQVHQQIADHIEAYTNDNIERVYFKELIQDWLAFDIGDTTRFDLTMASGYTLIAAREKLYKRTIEQAKDIGDYFRQYKVPEFM